MSWIISLRATYLFKYSDRIAYNTPADHIWLIEKHPVVFLAETMEELRRVVDGPYDGDKPPQRMLEINRVYSVIEVPEGLLTPAQLNLLAG